MTEYSSAATRSKCSPALIHVLMDVSVYYAKYIHLHVPYIHAYCT